MKRVVQARQCDTSQNITYLSDGLGKAEARHAEHIREIQVGYCVSEDSPGEGSRQMDIVCPDSGSPFHPEWHPMLIPTTPNGVLQIGYQLSEYLCK